MRVNQNIEFEKLKTAKREKKAESEQNRKLGGDENKISGK